MYNILSTKLDTKPRIQWHCVNANSNLSVLDTFLNQFESSYLSFNGSSTFNEDLAKQNLFQVWLKTRDNLLTRPVFETNFPYLKPMDINHKKI